MRRTRLFVGTGTEVVIQAMLPVCREVMRRAGRWPSDLFVLMADSDGRSHNRVRDAGLPADRAMYVPLSVAQVKEALSRSREELEDAWRPEWMSVVRAAPDNGACMIPALGRLMIKAARPVIARHLESVERQIGPDGGAPDIYVVLNPLSGTSRGSLVDMPRFLRTRWPDARIHAVLVYPIGLESMDRRTSSIYSTNFVEALRILDWSSSPRTYEVYVDPRTGWERREGVLYDDVFVFDAEYGNRRLAQLDRASYRLAGGLSELFGHVADFLVGIATSDRLSDWLLGRLADVSMHQGAHTIGGHRTQCHSVNDVRVKVDVEVLRRALLERAVQRALAPFSEEPAERRDHAGAAAQEFI